MQVFVVLSDSCVKADRLASCIVLLKSATSCLVSSFGLGADVETWIVGLVFADMVRMLKIPPHPPYNGFLRLRPVDPPTTDHR